VPIDKLAAFTTNLPATTMLLLTVAGKFDPRRRWPWIAELFGSIPAARSAPSEGAVPLPSRAQDGEAFGNAAARRRYAVRHGDVSCPRRNASRRCRRSGAGPACWATCPPAVSTKALVDNKKAVAASMDSEGVARPGFIVASAQLSPTRTSTKPVRFFSRLCEDFPRTSQQGGVERVKTRYQKYIELAFADSQRIALALTEYAAEGDWRMLFLERDRLPR